jgi:hypothetical protein
MPFFSLNFIDSIKPKPKLKLKSGAAAATTTKLIPMLFHFHNYIRETPDKL